MGYSQKCFIYLVCFYYNDSLSAVSACFDNEEAAYDFAKKKKDDVCAIGEYRVLKRALIK